MEPEQKALPEVTAPKTQQIPLKEPQKAELETIPEIEQPEERSPPKKEIPEPIHSPSPSPVKKEEPDIETTSKLKVNYKSFIIDNHRLFIHCRVAVRAGATGASAPTEI